MVTVLVHQDGVTHPAESVDPAWLVAGRARAGLGRTSRGRPRRTVRCCRTSSTFTSWRSRTRSQRRHHPKVESYDGFLYLILHEVVPYEQMHEAQTQDIDFFLARNLLVTVHTVPSPAISSQQSLCVKHHDVLAEGPVALLHRIVDDMVDGYRPSVDILEARLEALERTVFDDPSVNPLKEILGLKADVASAAPRRAARARRGGAARPARVHRDSRAAGVPVSRRVRPARPGRRRSRVLSGSRDGAARRVSVDAVEPHEPGHEGPDRSSPRSSCP